MNWLDLGLIIFLIIFIIIGIKQGFMKSVISNFSFYIVIIVAFFLYKPIMNLLENWFHLKSAIFNSYNNKFISTSADFETNLLSLSENELRPFVNSTLNLANLSFIPKLMFTLFLNNSSLYTKLHSSNLSSRNLSEILSSTYSSFYSTIISFIISVLLIYLVLYLFNLLINLLRKNGFIKIVDSVLGSIYGLGRACLIIIGICLVLKLLSPISFIQTATNYISDSFFGKIFYNQINNFLDNCFDYQSIISNIFH